MRIPRRGLGQGGEAVAPPSDGDDSANTEELAQRGDLHFQVVLLDDQPRPHDVKQLAFGHDPVAAFDQGHQQVECTGAQEGRLAVDGQRPFSHTQLESVEAQAVHHGLGNVHERPLVALSPRLPTRDALGPSTPSQTFNAPTDLPIPVIRDRQFIGRQCEFPGFADS